MSSRKVFYGWYLVAGATIVFFMTSSVNMFALAVLFKPMTAELGWSRTEFFVAQGLGAIVGAVAAPFVGRRVDRGNPRLLVLAGSILAGGSVLAYGAVHSLWLYMVLAGIVTPLSLSLCGMGVFNAVIGKWFVRKRGRALVIVATGVSVAGIVTPVAAVALVSWLDWRMTWTAFAIAFWVLMIPVALLVRRSPEDIGLTPDGVAPSAEGGQHALPGQDPEWTWHDLRRTRAFWLISLALGLAGMSMSGAHLHLYAFLTDQNVSPAVAGAIVSTVSITSLAFRPVWAYFLDRWDIRFIALLGYVTYAVSLVVLVLTTSAAVFFLNQGVRGAIAGVVVPSLATMLCARYFGRRSLGQVLGLAHLVGIPFAAAGPTLAAWLFDSFNSYTLVFSLFAGMFVLAAILVFMVRFPARTLPANAGLGAAGTR